MHRPIFRLIALFLLAGAFAVAAVDATRSLRAGRALLTEAGDAAVLAPARAAALQDSLAHAPDWLAASAKTAARAPAALALLLLGLAALRLARDPRAKIGYSNRNG